MPATDQQLRAIAFLAAACRPTGCKGWDEGGIYANLTKVRDRSLSTLTIAAIQAAEDRNAATPGVIPSAGPHWRAPEAAPVPRQTEPAHAMCVTCGKSKHAPIVDDHEYVSVDAARGMGLPNAEAAALTKQALRAEIRPLGDRPTTTHGDLTNPTAEES